MRPDPSGLERIMAWKEGLADPSEACLMLGVAVGHAEYGAVRLEAAPSVRFRNINGTMHGGWVSSLLDEAAGMAVLSTLPAGTSYGTLSLTVSFLRAAEPDAERFVIEGSVVKRGRRVCTAEARLLQPDGEACAVAVATCLIVEASTL